MKLRRMAGGLLSLAVAGLGTGNAAAFESVPLTMQERAGIARSNEPVVMGVPLPEGAIRSADPLTLTDPDGKTVPVEVRPIVKWPDGSIRWVHLYFLADCPASGSAVVTLREGKSAAPAGRLSVKDGTDAIAVDTGELTFTVRKKRFNLIDTATVGGEPVIAPHQRGGVVVVDGAEYLTSLDPDAKVVVEESGPMHVVIKATGSHKNAAGARKLDFVARLYAFAGSPVVRMTYTFVMAQGRKAGESIPLSALNLDIPTTLREGTVLFGDTGRAKSAKLGPDREAHVYAGASDSIEFGGAIAGTEKGKSAKPNRIGWADVGNGKVGVAAGVRWFWQMYPRSIEVDGKGLVRIGLYSARGGKPRDIYVGVARTHYVQLVFHGAADAAGLAARFAGLEMPLRPFASAKYYCRDAKAYGNVVEADPAQYKEEYRTLVEGWDRAFETNWQKFQKMIDGRTVGGAYNDDYGMLEWGDNFHYTKDASFGKLYEWNGNYYGYPHMMALQFARTGKPEYFDTFESHALHVADVHTVHHDPAGILTGGSRYCPPGDHVRVDNPPDYPVYFSDTFNHFKSEDIFERWYFTGDHRMLDVIAEQRRLVTQYKDADRSGGQPRGAGHLLMTLAKFAEDTGDPLFVARGKEVFDKSKDVVVKTKDGHANFQQGIQLEGARRYYEVSGNPEVLDYLKRWAKFFRDTGTVQRNAAQAFGFLYSKTGDAQYLDLALQCIRRPAGDQKPGGVVEADGGLRFEKEKDFALTMRNGPYFFYYLSNHAPAPGK